MDFQWLLLLGSGFVSGMINAVAGGGTIVIYPVLLAMGLPPISANASSNGVVVLGTFSSAFGYRKYIANLPKRYFLLIIPVLIGSLIGVVLLANTSNRTFEYIVPWLVLTATILLLAQTRINNWLSGNKRRKSNAHSVRVFGIISILMIGIALYGGYFGAGYGIITLAILGFSELSNINQLNSLKNITSICVGVVSVVYLSSIGLINWSVIPLLMIGNVVGGWFGATYSSKLPSKLIRNIIIGFAVILSLILFAKRYL